MKRVSAYLDHAITFLLLVVAGFTPLFFFNQFTEFYEIPKLIFLIVATILIIGLWIFSSILKGKVVITRTPLDIPLLVLLIVILISTFVSESRNTAIFGNFPRVHGSAVAWVTYILLYYVTVSHLRNLSQIKTFVYVLLGSAAVVSLVTLLAFFGIYIPADFAKAVNFTPTGSSFSTLALLLLVLPLPLLSVLNPNKYLPVPAAVALSVLFGVTIALIGSIPTYVALFLVFVISIFASKPAQVKRNIALFLIPTIVTGLTLFLAYGPIPSGLRTLETNFPKEVQLPLPVSWKVSVSAFRDAWPVGTGPATYLYNFTSYKPLEFNQLQYWNVSFDTATNEFLQALGTLGLLGLLAIIFVCVIVLNSVRKNISVSAAATKEHDGKDHVDILLPALAISGLISIVLLVLHATTLVSLVVSFFIFALLMVSQKAIREKEMSLSMGIKASTSDNRQFDLFPVILFIVFLVGAVPALIQTYKAVAADYWHRQALAQATTNGSLTYQYLQKAEALNPNIDLYRVDMAQTNFALADALAAQKGPTKDNPNGTFTNQDIQTIQTLLSQAINEARTSVALSPRSSRNWEVLALIYRNITGVAQNSLLFSLDSYGRAIQRDPLNPVLRVNVGNIYYSIRNYDLAIRFFSDAANLKPDYANAYFNLALALRDKGDLQNAKAVSDVVVNLLAKNQQGADYKTAVKLRDEINDKIKDASNQAGQTPAQQPENALANPDQPDVNVNTGNAPSVTPVPSVKPNPNANIPQISPSPAQGQQ